MATNRFAGQEFEFPDEKEAKAAANKEPDFEIEIEDDTPVEDRGRKKLETPPDDPTEDELSSYDEKVQSRIKKFTRGYHDERRAKEEALRERQAAEEYAKQVLEQNRRLQQQLAQGNNAYIEQSKAAAEAELVSAKKRYKDAYEAGDAEALTEAQAHVSWATMKLDKAHSMKPLQVPQNVVQPQQQVQQPSSPSISERDKRWMQDNTWFGPDPEMTASALGLHKKLAAEFGDRFVGSEEYYKRVDKTMRKRFPEYFGSDEEDTTSKMVSEPADEDEPLRRAKNVSVVAPASRSTPPNRIKLKASEANTARRLGVPLEEYAKQVALLRRG
jgi:hypothetical protein